MWLPQWEFEYDSKTNSTKATKKSLCCPAKCAVAFKHCLLIKNQQKRITRCSVCRESCQTTLIKAPIHMKAISRQRQLFRSSLPRQPPFAPQQECGTVGLCDLPLYHWRGQPAPAASHFFTRMPAPLPVPGPSPGFCPPACLPDWRVPIGDAAVQLPAGRMKSLFDGSLDGLASLLSVSRLLSGLITSNTRAAVYDDGALCTILYCLEERLYLYFLWKKNQLYFEIEVDTRNYTVTPLNVS